MGHPIPVIFKTKHTRKTHKPLPKTSENFAIKGQKPSLIVIYFKKLFLTIGRIDRRI